MENESSGVLRLVNAQPSSPQALIHWRPSARAGFSVNVLIAPAAPAFTSSHLIFAGLSSVRASLPRRSILERLRMSLFLTSTTSAVMPSGGVGPLHIPSDAGTFS